MTERATGQKIQEYPPISEVTSATLFEGFANGYKQITGAQVLEYILANGGGGGGSSDNLTLAGTDNLATLKSANAAAVSNALGVRLNVYAGNGDGTGAGGTVVVAGGTGGDTGSGGVVAIYGGTGGATSGDGGAVTISGGGPDDLSGAGGAVTIDGGTGEGDGNQGGVIIIRAGSSNDGATGDGGAVQIHGGQSNTTDGNGGDVTIGGGAKSGSGIDGRLIFLNVPTVAPAASGAVWRDPDTNVLMIVP